MSVNVASFYFSKTRGGFLNDRSILPSNDVAIINRLGIRQELVDLCKELNKKNKHQNEKHRLRRARRKRLILFAFCTVIPVFPLLVLSFAFSIIGYGVLLPYTIIMTLFLLWYTFCSNLKITSFHDQAIKDFNSKCKYSAQYLVLIFLRICFNAYAN